MKAFYKNNNGLIEVEDGSANCWINIECPTATEKKYLLEELQIPEAFITILKILMKDLGLS